MRFFRLSFLMDDCNFRYGVALYYPPGNFPNQYSANVQQREELEDNRLA